LGAENLARPWDRERADLLLKRVIEEPMNPTIAVQRELAGAVYEIRQNLELVDRWRRPMG